MTEIQRELIGHLVTTGVFYLAILLLRQRFGLGEVLLFLGLGMGTFLLDLDHVLLVFLRRPDLPEGKEAMRFLKKGDYLTALKVIYEPHKSHTNLIFHAAPFQIALWVICFYVVTTTGSNLAAGLCMGAGLNLLKDEWEDYINDPNHLNKWLFWQIRRSVSLKLQKNYLRLITLLFVGMSLFLV